jgi:hypothetical protein
MKPLQSKYWAMLLKAAQGTIFVTLIFFVLASRSEARNFALLIGCGSYDHYANLPSVCDDVRYIETALKVGGKFRANDIKTLTSDSPQVDLRPDLDTISQALDEMDVKCRTGCDILFVYFGGHGYLDRQNDLSYILTRHSYDDDLKNTALAATTFRNRLQSMHATYLVVAYEICRNGVRPAASGTPLPAMNVAFARDLAPLGVFEQEGMFKGPTGCATLFSCRPSERSYEIQVAPSSGTRPKWRGAFAYWIARGITGGAADNDGSVRISTLVPYVEKHVYATVMRTIHQSEKPWSTVDGTGTFDITLAIVKRHSTNATERAGSDVGGNNDEGVSTTDQSGTVIETALAFSLKGDDEKAKPLFEHALNLNISSADSALANYQLGRILYLAASQTAPNAPIATFKNAVQPAFEKFQQARKDDPSFADPVRGLADISYDIGWRAEKYHGDLVVAWSFFKDAVDRDREAISLDYNSGLTHAYASEALDWLVYVGGKLANSITNATKSDLAKWQREAVDEVHTARFVGYLGTDYGPNKNGTDWTEIVLRNAGIPQR